MKHFLKSVSIIQAGLVAVVIAFFTCAPALAQTATLKVSSDLIDSTEKYKASSNELLELQEAALKVATQKLEELRQLVAEGLVARIELDQAEQTLAAAKAKIEATKEQVSSADHLIAQTKAAEALAASQAAVARADSVQARKARILLTPTILRYNGSASWLIGKLPEVQSFFQSTFGRTLPTSAIGQSATHNALGYDHRNAVDVALHPDSLQGKALISYLQSKGIPYLAFRAAVPGVATGPHIHIGSPSHRLG